MRPDIERETLEGTGLAMPDETAAPDASTLPDPGINAREEWELRQIGKSVLNRMIHEHPTLALTLIYLALTVVGLIHDLWFYFYFRFNILEFSETSDFLLAAIRNPLVILLSILPVGLLLIGVRIRKAATRRSPRYEAFNRRMRGSRWNSPASRVVTYGLFILIYAAVFTQLYAEAMSKRVKAGHGRRVTFARVDGTTPGEQPILLGSTTKFLFLYYPARRVTEIVPIENTAMITVDARSRKQRQRDSAAALEKP